MLAIRKIAYAKKPIGSSGTWGCGFTQPTTRDAVHRVLLCRIHTELFQTGGTTGRDPSTCEGPLSRLRPITTAISMTSSNGTWTYVIVRPVMWLFDKIALDSAWRHSPLYWLHPFGHHRIALFRMIQWMMRIHWDETYRRPYDRFLSLCHRKNQ